MSYLSSTRDINAAEPRLGASTLKAQADGLTTFGHGMLVTGNVICTGAVQVFGRVLGDIQAAQLVISEGARVEGRVTVKEAVIQGTFHGTITGNSVKLQGNAVVEGEIYNRSLTVEPNVVFEGVSRRLDRAIEAPAAADVAGQFASPPVAPTEPMRFEPQLVNTATTEVDNDVLA